MPAKNIVKHFVSHGIYHLYNRSIAKTPLFKDDFDYLTFLSIVEKYLSPINSSPTSSPHPFLPIPLTSIYKSVPPSRLKYQQRMNLHSDIDLLAFCLMPNHYHFLVKQSSPSAITAFIRRISTAYSMYYNLRYKRTGPLFAGIYKAALAVSDSQVIHLSRYIHLNPVSIKKIGLISTTSGIPAQYPYSSYQYYIEKAPPVWLTTSQLISTFKDISAHFSNHYHSYQEFVEDYRLDSGNYLSGLLLDS